MAALQQLVDHLSEALEQPVLVDDASFHTLAYSAHGSTDLDDVRTASIIGRRAAPEVVERLRAEGVTEVERPVQIGGDAELGLSPRWCVPIRHDGRLLGFVWVIADRELAAGHIDRLERFADGAAVAIEEERSDAQLTVSAQRALRTFLSADATESCDAGARLVRAGVVSAGQSATVLVGRAGDAPLDDAARVLASLGLQTFAAAVGGRGVLGGVWDDGAVCMIAGHDPVSLGERADPLARELHACLARAWDGYAAPAVGRGAVADSLTGARRSYEQACWAANVAARVPECGPVAAWDELGIYQLLHAVDGDRDALPGGLRALLDSPNGEMLVETLEVYLDTGGDAQATASRLFLARGSLYYRLHRIEELADVSLRSGSDRLVLHLGLKIARLCGLWGAAARAEREPPAIERVA